MSLVGFSARNHPQQSGRRGALESVDDRKTPADLFAAIASDWGPFTLDAAASAENAQCARYVDRETDGLAQSWVGERVWVNPPYSDLRPWLEKAWAETGADVVAMLLPANRTEQRWWQDLVEPYRDRAGSPLRTRFYPGRPRFSLPGQRSVLGDRPPFGVVLVVWATSAPPRPVVPPDLFTGAPL